MVTGILLFFHKMAQIRNSSKQMNILKLGDLILENQADIERHVLDFYSTLYASENSCSDSGLVRKVIPQLVSAEDNSMLTGLPVMDEVKSVVFSMIAEGAPGPDGFGGCFYRAFWDIVGMDVYQSVLQFFKSGWIMPNLNSNIVALVPKFPEAEKITDYRPIALANFQRC